MGATGPPPDSNVTRLRKGLPTLNVPQAVSGVPPCPEWLTPDARWMWERVTPELDRLGLLGWLDVATLEAFCLCYGEWRAAEALLALDGVVTVGSRDQPVRHPAHDVAMARLREMRLFAIQLGLSPAARQRMVRPSEGAGHGEESAVFGG